MNSKKGELTAITVFVHNFPKTPAYYAQSFLPHLRNFVGERMLENQNLNFTNSFISSPGLPLASLGSSSHRTCRQIRMPKREREGGTQGKGCCRFTEHPPHFQTLTTSHRGPRKEDHAQSQGLLSL